jgi:hypothetical protein
MSREAVGGGVHLIWGAATCTSLLGLQGCVSGDALSPQALLSWSQVPSGTTEQLTDVWGSSASDIWAVGFNGSIVHYDGSHWARVLDGVSYAFTGVWGSGPSDVWAVGYRSLSNTAPVIFHYDGRAWVQDAAVADTLPSPPLTDIWGTEASNVWAVGYAGRVLHFDGVHWVDASVDPSFHAERIWGTSATDAWIVGPATVLHFDGSGWMPQSDAVLTEAQLLAGWGAGRDDLWAAGDVGRGFVHFDGSSWRRVMPADTTFAGWFWSLWGVTPSCIWAVASSGVSGRGVGAVWQYDGTAWSIVARDTVNLRGIWASSASDAWAVGDHGAILHGQPLTH